MQPLRAHHAGLWRKLCLYLALATLRVSPALLVHLLGDAHKVCLDNSILDAGQTLLLDIEFLASLVSLDLCAYLTPAPAR